MPDFWTDDEMYLVAVRGHDFFLQGRYAEAAAVFEGLRAVRPGDLYCANALAAVYVQLGRVDGAIDILTEALARHPDDTDTRMRRCEAYAMAGRLVEARQDSEILRRAPVPGHRDARLDALLDVLLDGSAVGPKEFRQERQLPGADPDN